MSEQVQEEVRQQDAFAKELGMLVERYINEWDLSVVSIIGVLETVKLDLFTGATTTDDEEE
jgi:hypothetical protein